MASTKFLGTVDSDWSNASNWDNGVPASGDGKDVYIEANCSLSVNSTTDSSQTLYVGTTYTLTLGDYDLHTGNITSWGAWSQGSGSVYCVDATFSSTVSASADNGYIYFTGNFDVSQTSWSAYSSGNYGPYLVWNGTSDKTFTAFGGSGKAGGDVSNHIGTILMGSSASAKLTFQGGSSGDILYAKFQITEGLSGSEFELTGGREYRCSKMYHTVWISGGSGKMTILKGDGINNTIIRNSSAKSSGIIYYISSSVVLSLNGDDVENNTGYEIYGRGDFSKYISASYAVSGTIIRGVKLYEGYFLLGVASNQDYVSNVILDKIAIDGHSSIYWWLRLEGSNNKIKFIDLEVLDSLNQLYSVNGTGNSIYIDGGSFNKDKLLLNPDDVVVAKDFNGVSGDTYIWANKDVDIDSSDLVISGMVPLTTENVTLYSAKAFTLTSLSPASLKSISGVSGSSLILDRDFSLTGSDSNLYTFTINSSKTLTLNTGARVRVLTSYTNNGTLTLADGSYLHDNANKEIHAYEGLVKGDNSLSIEGDYSLKLQPNSTNYLTITYNHNNENKGFTVDRNQEYNVVFSVWSNKNYLASDKVLSMIVSTSKSGSGQIIRKNCRVRANKWKVFQKAFNSGDNDRLYITFIARRKYSGDAVTYRIDDCYLEKVIT